MAKKYRKKSTKTIINDEGDEIEVTDEDADVSLKEKANRILDLFWRNISSLGRRFTGRSRPR